MLADCLPGGWDRFGVGIVAGCVSGFLRVDSEFVGNLQGGLGSGKGRVEGDGLGNTIGYHFEADAEGRSGCGGDVVVWAIVVVMVQGRDQKEMAQGTVFRRIVNTGHHIGLERQKVNIQNERFPGSGKVVIIDNSSIEDDLTTRQRYFKLPQELIRVFDKYISKNSPERRASIFRNVEPERLKMKWRTCENELDNGVFLMSHMDNYFGEAESKWEYGFCKESNEQTKQLKFLRSKYAARILLSENNSYKDEFQKEVDKVRSILRLKNPISLDNVYSIGLTSNQN
ncbi:hypothetical protein Tco_0201485 [Tanacetum coccineum]